MEIGVIIRKALFTAALAVSQVICQMYGDTIGAG